MSSSVWDFVQYYPYYLMARQSTTLKNAKDNAPEIPNITCPYIDFAQSILDEIKDETSEGFIHKKISLINDLLEYIRDSNDALRKNGTYWYNKYTNKKP